MGQRHQESILPTPASYQKNLVHQWLGLNTAHSDALSYSADAPPHESAAWELLRVQALGGCPKMCYL